MWEEVLVLAPAGMVFVSLSATVRNATDFGAWLALGPGNDPGGRRDPPAGHAPPSLRRRRTGPGRPAGVIPLLRDGEPNPDGLALDEAPDAAVAGTRYAGAAAHRGDRVPGRGRHASGHHLHLLAGGLRRRHPPVPRGRRPADHRRRTGPHPRARPRRPSTASDDDDLRTLGYGPWSAALEAGIAPHHAGLVPAFRQAVEQCFSEGLLKVVFATETLALGINMPARTVVVERFAKFRGVGHLGPDVR